MAQQVKALANKPDGLSLIPGSPVPHVCLLARAPPPQIKVLILLIE